MPDRKLPPYAQWGDDDLLIEKLRGLPGAVLTSREREKPEEVVPASLSFRRIPKSLLPSGRTYRLQEGLRPSKVTFLW